ncbi:MAG: nucleotidyltransferase domain-containing protein [Peptococcaceae bacterium]|nr:nucleotidyltransferase domain-containing protein [Peptococcaceae bacterium]
MQTLTTQELNTILDIFVEECKALFGEKLSNVRLFGSYARGDHSDDSDIDVMVILDMSEEETRRSLDGVCHIASELDLKYNTAIMPVLVSKGEYELHKDSYGFCRNVEREGVSKYAG